MTHCATEESIRTIEMTQEIIDLYPGRGLRLGEVYTMVTWDLDTWAQTGSDRDGEPQAFPGHPGTAGRTIIQYRAGVPLFENTMDFGDGDEGEDLTPTPDSRKQGANLDNNRGASTRHGSATADGDHDAKSYVNVASASGTWKGVESSDADDHRVDAVDVRVVKSVRVGHGDDWASSASFEQGAIADYRLSLATSEYVSAAQGDSPNRFTDELDNGLCPVFPTGIRALLTPGVGQPADDDDSEGWDQLGQPNLLLVDAGEPGERRAVGAAEFNDALAAAGLSECRWADAVFTDDALFQGATLSGITFDPTTGRFSQEFQLADAALGTPNKTHDVIYSVHQNRSYLDAGDANGSTSSGDTVSNSVEIDLTTTARPGVNGLENSEGVGAGGDHWAWDDSAAQLEADFSGMSKWVLKNEPGSGGLAPADLIAEDFPTPTTWVDPEDPVSNWTKNEERPFAVGDEVWFRIHYQPASGADVRNPVLTDFLPEGVEFDAGLLDDENQWQDSPNYRAYVTNGGRQIDVGSVPLQIGTCRYDGKPGHTAADAYDEFVGTVDVDERRLTWTLGSNGCFPTGDPSASQDAFWPKGLNLDIYLRVTVTDAEAFGNQDLTQNLAKYQQENVEGQVFFLRDAAEIQAATGPQLIKGVKSVTPPVPSEVEGAFNSDLDHERVQQRDEATYRVDVTAPFRGVDPATGGPRVDTATTDWVVWDALPAGIVKADVKGADPDSGVIAAPNAAVKLSQREWIEHPTDPSQSGWAIGADVSDVAPAQWTATVCDPADDCHPNNTATESIDPEFANRTLVKWTLGAAVPSSTPLAEIPDPDFPDDETKNIVVQPVERGFSLQYTVVIPDGTKDGTTAALAEQEYENTASIVKFSTLNNTGAPGAHTTLVPACDEGATSCETLSTTPPAAGERGIPADSTVDESDVYLDAPEMEKRLVSTEVGPTAADGNGTVGLTDTGDALNTQSVVVQGELAVYEYSITVPARTSIKGATISDGGSLGGGVRYNYVAGSAKFYGPDAAGAATVDLTTACLAAAPGTTTAVRCAEQTGAAGSERYGVLTLPDEYRNDSDTDQRFRVRITAWVDDADHSNPDRTPNIADGASLVNTATFAYVDPNAAVPGTTKTQSDTATTTYRDPSVSIEKSASPNADVEPGAMVDYTLTLTNTGPTIYDPVVEDCIPARILAPTDFTPAVGGLVDPATSCSIGDDGEIVKGSGTGKLARWALTGTKVETGASVELGYRAQLDPSIGGGSSQTNVAEATGHTLPASLGNNATDRRGDRFSRDDETVTVSDASIAKSVDKAEAPVGDTVAYTVTVTLPERANFYDVRLTDTLPKGVEFVSAVGTPQFGGWAAGTQPTVAGPASDGDTAAGETLTWTLTPDDFPWHTEDRTITVSYSAKITDAVETGTPTNVATLSWNSENGNEDSRVERDDDATVTILDPELAIDKQVRIGTGSWGGSAQGNPDSTVQYRLVVTNTGDTAAHNATVTDCIPTGIVNVTGISNGGATGAATGACPGGTITWTGLGPIAAGGSITLSYTATFAPSATQTSNANGQGVYRVNTANVTHFESFPRDPADPDTPTGREYDPTDVRDTAQARPLFPRVTLAKSVTDGDIAYADTPFGWTLRVNNTGRGVLQNVEVRDTLPVNWSYTASVTPQIRANGTGAWLDLAAPSGAPGPNLTWSEAQIRAALGVTGTNPVLGASNGTTHPYFEIRFSATPSQAALVDAGVTNPTTGVRVPHTNTLQATGKDTTGATGNASGDYVTNTGSANAFLHSADLEIAKVGASAPIHAGSTNVLGWTVTVTNNGPDTAVGTSAKPIGVTDVTGPLPDGVVVSSVSGAGWTCDAAPFDRDDDTGATAFECVRTNAADTLAKDASFPPITVNVTVAADQPEVAAGVILNTATVVPGATHDPDDSNNEATDDITIDNLADLTIAKTVVTPAPANVGDPIAWQIKAWNAGPSVSRADDDHPITVTDTIPAGVTGVTATGTANWVPSATRGGAPVGDLTALQPGDIVTWTYQGAQLPVGTQAGADALTLSGTILTSHVGPLANTATVTPGLTPEPTVDPLPNDSTVTVTPGSDTRLDVAKERVVPDGAGGWRTAGVDDEFVAGTDISYRITVANLGPADARDVRVVDEVPAGLSYKAPHDSVSGTWTRTAGGTTSTGGPNANWDTFALAGTQPAGSTRQFVVTYSTLPTVPASFQNCAEGTIQNWITTDAQRYDRACNDSGSTRVVDLGIAKTHTGAGPFDAGTSVPYTITVTNHGPSASGGPLTVTDQLPVGMSWDSAVASTVSVAGGAAMTLAPVPDPATGRLLTWTVPIPVADPLEPGETVVITVSAAIDPTVRGGVTLGNTATVTGVENEPTGPGTHPNTATDQITTRTNAVMEIEKVVSAGPWIAGDTVTYTLTVTNSGPSAAPASVEDVLPAGLTLVSMSGTNWDCSDAEAGDPSGSCDYLDAADDNPVTQVLHPVGTSTITVVARIGANVQPTPAAPAPGLVNTATVAWSDTDGPGTDSDTAEIRVTTDADLGIVKGVITGAGGTVVADPAPATAGSTVWYRLAVSNYGLSDAAGPVTVTDELPLGVTVPTAVGTVNGWTMTPGPVTPGNRQTVAFTLPGGLAGGTDADPVAAPVIEFQANIDPSVADETTLVNDADVTSPTADSRPSNNDDDASILVARSADLEVSKTHPSDANGQVQIDQPLDFTIRVTNHGPSDSSGFTIVDTMPAGIEVTSVAGPVAGTDWVIDSVVPVTDPDDPDFGKTLVEATYSGTTEPGEAAQDLVISTIVRESVIGAGPEQTVVNHVAITDANELDPEPENDEADDPIEVRPRVTLVTEKTAVGEFQVGEPGTYRITVENLGPHMDPGPITVTDALPKGLTYRASPNLPAGTTVAVSGQTVVWTVQNGLDVGESVELTLVVNVNQGAYPEVTNTVVVDSPAEKTPDSILTDAATVTVEELDLLSITGVGSVAYLALLAALLMLAGAVVSGVRGRRSQHSQRSQREVREG